MSTTGVLVSGRHRRRRVTAASLGRFARVARDPQSYRNLLYLRSRSRSASPTWRSWSPACRSAPASR